MNRQLIKEENSKRFINEKELTKGVTNSKSLALSPVTVVDGGIPAGVAADGVCRLSVDRRRNEKKKEEVNGFAHNYYIYMSMMFDQYNLARTQMCQVDGRYYNLYRQHSSK